MGLLQRCCCAVQIDRFHHDLLLLLWCCDAVCLFFAVAGCLITDKANFFRVDARGTFFKLFAVHR